MLKGALLGTVVGLLGAAAGILASVTVYTIVNEDLSRLPGALAGSLVVIAFMAFLAAPGAFVLGLPLASVVRFILANVPSRRLFFIFSAAAGTPLGLINLHIGHALFDLLLRRNVVIHPDLLSDPYFGVAAMAGGVGLGLGVAMTVQLDSILGQGAERLRACFPRKLEI